MAEAGPSQRSASVWCHVGRTLLLPVHAKDDQRPELCDEVRWRPLHSGTLREPCPVGEYPEAQRLSCFEELGVRSEVPTRHGNTALRPKMYVCIYSL